MLPSALKHGVDPEDALHAVQLALVVDEIGDDPLRYLLIEPDRAGNLPELVVLDRRNGPAVIQAMRMRPQYRRLLSREP